MSDTPASEAIRMQWRPDSEQREFAVSGTLLDSLYPSLELSPSDAAADWSSLANIRVVSATEPARLLFGVPEAETLAGRRLNELVAFESAPAVASLLAAAARGSEPRTQIALIRTLDAQSLAVRIAVAAGEQSVRLLFSIVERPVEVASRLQISEQRYTRLFNDVPIALMRVNSRGTLHLFGMARDAGYGSFEDYLDDHPEAFEAALDRTVIAEANDRSIDMFGSSDPASVLCPVRAYFRLRPGTFRRIMCAAFSGARHYVEETVVCGMAGQERPVLFAIALAEALEVEGNSFVGMIDISDRLRTEAELKRIKGDFARSARISLMGELAASIAHEVMQPLSSIAVNSGTAMTWLSKDPPDVARVGRRIERFAADADRTVGIIRRLRTMAAGGAAERTCADLNNLTREALSFVADEALSHNVVVETHLGKSLPPLVVDPVQVQQVVVNLVNNAIQAIVQDGSPGGRILVETSHDGEGWLDLVVEDNGPGVPEEHLPRIFESFFTTKNEGIGMGLTICKSIVEAHLGTLSLKRVGPRGARAQVRLPAGEPERGSGGKHQQSASI
jgi:signal transduction histidine kinase